MQSSRRVMPLALAAMVACVLANVSVARAAEKPEGGTKFLRFVEEGRDGGRLETAIATYKNDKGQQVHLVAAVHIGDPGYYASLNKTFEGYDALLFEMVKPKDLEMAAAGKAPRGGGVGVVQFIQRAMKYFLELDYQLDGIDYTKKNFVHADLTAEEFERLQDERGESMLGMMVQNMFKEMAKGNGGAGAQMDPSALLEAFLAPDSARRLKMVLAKQFENMEEMVKGMEGPNGSVLLTERNKACMKVIKEQLEAGKKNLGVFYGAAHMMDLEKRLGELGFKRTGLEYRVAWDMSAKGGRGGDAREAADAPPAREVKPDDRDAKIDKLLEKIERLEKKLDDMEKGKK
ncbi:MAG: hypothetical protein ACAI43_11215 [Phycisphaerae bacterium]|nr:hypothetical protein [Tepidisphaeraceae bacterium]